MPLQFALVQTIKELSQTIEYTIQYLDGDDPLEAKRSGPLTNLEITPRPGQLVAVDQTIHPLEIVHVYDHLNHATLTEEDRTQLARTSFPDILARHTPLEQTADPDPASRYMSWTGIAAQAWDHGGGDEEQFDNAYLKRIIESNNGPALDIGCGTGRLLLRYLAAGLDVDGLDSSADMLAICREKGAVKGLNPTLYQQSMHELDLPRKYKTIFIPCGTFCLLINREDAMQALGRMYDHLEPGGALVFNLFWEYGKGGWFWNEIDGKWHRMWYDNLPNGDQVFHSVTTDKVDHVEQQHFGRRRYRLVRNGQVLREEIFPAYERAYGKHEIQMMLELTGFRDVKVYDGWQDEPEPFAGKHNVMVIHGRK
jgi:SAM-dependent methyltransferase